jgi:hypothetical protein
LAFRLRPTIEWTGEKWATLEGIARDFGLTIVVTNAIHLQVGPEKQETASIHEIGAENDVCIVPDYERGDELLEAIGTRLFGATTGP